MADRFATSRNFLATDRVPDSIFGIPVVSRREDYLDSDIEFFRKRPEAGGFYSLGKGPTEDGEPRMAEDAGFTIVDPVLRQVVTENAEPQRLKSNDIYWKITQDPETNLVNGYKDREIGVFPITENGVTRYAVDLMEHHGLTPPNPYPAKAEDITVPKWENRNFGTFDSRKDAELARAALAEQIRENNAGRWADFVHNNWAAMSPTVKERYEEAHGVWRTGQQGESESQVKDDALKEWVKAFELRGPNESGGAYVDIAGDTPIITNHYGLTRDFSAPGQPPLTLDTRYTDDELDEKVDAAIEEHTRRASEFPGYDSGGVGVQFITDDAAYTGATTNAFRNNTPRYQRQLKVAKVNVAIDANRSQSTNSVTRLNNLIELSRAAITNSTDGLPTWDRLNFRTRSRMEAGRRLQELYDQNLTGQETLREFRRHIPARSARFFRVKEYETVQGNPVIFNDNNMAKVKRAIRLLLDRGQIRRTDKKPTTAPITLGRAT